MNSVSFHHLRFAPLQCAFLALALLPNGWAQAPTPSPVSGQDALTAKPVEPSERQLADSVNRESHKLTIGPGDELDVKVFNVPELSQHVRVDVSGDVHLLLVGTVRVAGLSSEEAQDVIEKQLIAGSFMNNPHVTVYVKEFTNQSVSVMGEVNKPGSYPALTTRRLYDAFQEAGGLTPTAGNKVSISHPGQLNTPTIVMLSNDPIKSAQANVEIMPGDAVKVSKGNIVYVLGEVTKPGGYLLSEESDGGDFSGKVTVMRVIALASGPVHGATLSKSKIIRRTTSGLQEIPINLKEIMAGKTPDPPLQAEDILFLPGRRSNPVATNVLSSLITSAIYRF